MPGKFGSLLLVLGTNEGLATGGAASGIFCLLDLRPAEPECDAAEEDGLSFTVDFLLSPDGVSVEDGLGCRSEARGEAEG